MATKVLRPIALLLLAVTLLLAFAGCAKTELPEAKNAFITGQEAKTDVETRVSPNEIKDLARKMKVVTPQQNTVQLRNVKKMQTIPAFTIGIIISCLLIISGVAILPSFESGDAFADSCITVGIAIITFLLLTPAFNMHYALFLPTNTQDSKSVCVEFRYTKQDTEYLRLSDVCTSAYVEADGKIYEAELYGKTLTCFCDEQSGVVSQVGDIIIKADIPKTLLKAGTPVVFTFTVDGAVYRAVYQK